MLRRSRTGRALYMTPSIWDNNEDVVGTRVRDGWLAELSRHDQHRLRNLEAAFMRVRYKSTWLRIFNKLSTFFYDCMERESCENPFGWNMHEVWVARDAMLFYRPRLGNPCIRCGCMLEDNLGCPEMKHCEEYVLWIRAERCKCRSD